MIKQSFIAQQPEISFDSHFESSLNEYFENEFYLSIQDGVLIIGYNGNPWDKVECQVAFVEPKTNEN